jgi:hypothetical protein
MNRTNDVRSTDVLRHGAYVCMRVPAGARSALADLPIPALAARFRLRNEFEPGDDHPTEAVAFLRRVGAMPGQRDDPELLHADAVMHVASPNVATVAQFCAETTRLLAPVATPLVLSGVVRPMVYTGNAMHNFAYAHRVLQQPGAVAPNAFLVPMSKTTEWWRKDWMERHTYLLPRYDDDGRMVSEGHALAAAAGIDCLMRRTYKHPTEPAPNDAYDFLTYFECADADVPTFHAVSAALRDLTRNPEWRFVREGPTWQGRRVATWAELFAK